MRNKKKIQWAIDDEDNLGKIIIGKKHYKSLHIDTKSTQIFAKWQNENSA
ncbi:MAG: hypothetical protein LKE40_12370 [Spirochaetia bacterium]|jgi:hypothetical protein|nr:hypothetical protein [Spirochaetia bacterium]